MTETETATAWPDDSTRTRAAGTLSLVSERAVVNLLTLLHLSITLPLAYTLNIWTDEAYTLDTTARDVAYALRQALDFELQAPLYFVLLNLWRTASESVFFARLFSVACIALMLRLVVPLSRRFLPGINPCWTLGAFALHPFVVWAAIEIRLYALALLLAATLLLLFYEAYLAEKSSRRARVLYALVALVALYTHYYLGFLLVANACALVALGRWRALRSYLFWMMGVGVCFAPMLLIIKGQRATLTRDAAQTTSLLEAVKVLSWRFYDYVLPAGWTPLQFAQRWLVRFGLLCAVFVFIREARRSKRPAHFAVWTIATVTTLFYLVSLLLTGETLLLTRHTTVLFLPLMLLVLSTLEAIPRKSVRYGAAAVAFFFYVASLCAAYAPLAKTGDWERVARHISAAEQSGQPVAVFRGSGALPLKHYYKGLNPLVAIPVENRFDTFRPRDEIIADEAQLSRAFARAPREHEYLWLVTEDACVAPGAGYNCRALEEFVEANYTVESRRDFYRAQVRLLRRRDSQPD
ncbi:MAG TPA: hypothetical protein VNA19_05735 [Pyrinomonadaceae bacterium]|jgi:hypothetical protein|nr:hypothetical protein [Pyrinomonadaceae bacterium]